MKENLYREREMMCEREVVAAYLEHGSVEELESATMYSLPFSFASIHRILDRYGVIKAAGPNKPITETIGFFVKMIEKKVPLETLYRSMPPRFAPSMTTLHRIYRKVKEEVKKEGDYEDYTEIEKKSILGRIWDWLKSFFRK